MAVLRWQWQVGFRFAVGLAVLIAAVIASGAARSEVTAFKQAVAEAAAQNDDLAGFYRDNDYRAIWTGPSARDAERRKAFFAAIDAADTHGLPPERYDPEGLMRRLADVRSPRDRGLVEVEMSRRFLRLARDMHTGMLDPGRIDDGIKREVHRSAAAAHLGAIMTGEPTAFFRALPPDSHEYARLIKEKLRLERTAARGGWGKTVAASSLKPGQSGAAVVELRNRLTAMGYLDRSISQDYGAAMQRAVQDFQNDHGLTADGVAGPGTLDEINRSAEDRLRSILVAMERERWFNIDRGERHILVNITDFTAKILDQGSVTFETRSVVGATNHDRRTPEFSDVMEHMVINPTWHVPRSIAVKEYLPQLKRNPNAVGHLRLVDARGRVVSRGAVNFGAYNARNFPFNIKQPPSRGNALGLVKFMFPNKYNIYLHDTPTKHLFERETRAYSHGCIRLQQPFDFAYELLSRQTDDPKGLFHSHLNTGRETTVKLETPVPVHLIYRTAYTRAKGKTQYRRDIYGRDAAIWSALAKAGVAPRPVQG